MREIYGTSEPPTVSPRQQLELQQQPFLTGLANVNVDGGKHIANENVGMDEEGIASFCSSIAIFLHPRLRGPSRL
jgi:hypothetical protein